MSRARDIADLVDANGDIVVGALDNVPASNDASALTTGTLDAARLPTEIVSSDTTPQLGGALDLNSSNITGTGSIDITGNAQFSYAGIPLFVNATNSSGYKIAFRDNSTAVAYYGANSTYPMLVSNSAGTNILYCDTSGNLYGGRVLMANYSANAVGTTVLGWLNNTAVSPGYTASGSLIMYSNTSGSYRPSYIGSGTWRCHGAVPGGSASDEVTVWQRVS